MAETTFFDYIAALETGLAAHMAGTAGFESVGVVQAETNETPWETVILVRADTDTGRPPAVTVTQRWAAVGSQRRDDEYLVPCRVGVQKTAFESQAALTAAGQRCEAIVSQVVAYLRDVANWPAVGDQTIRTIVQEVTYTMWPTADGWAALADFDIDVRIRVS